METRTNQMTIKNLDFMPLIVNAISISGADATDFSWSGLTLPLSIAPNSSASFDLHFTPSGIGSNRPSSLSSTMIVMNMSLTIPYKARVLARHLCN
ncbi:MAG: hypothetical protein HWD58_08440 [Bacteroidota bacterium]|nr:MAG: hypothetical protein HWD58_08440 [Bacteroidota bacterium]